MSERRRVRRKDGRRGGGRGRGRGRQREGERELFLCCVPQGNALYREGEYVRAVECYSRGMMLDPHSAVLPANRAMALLKLERCVHISHTHIHSHMYVHSHAHTYTHTLTHIIHVRTFTHIHTHTCTCTCSSIN